MFSFLFSHHVARQAARKMHGTVLKVADRPMMLEALKNLYKKCVRKGIDSGQYDMPIRTLARQEGMQENEIDQMIMELRKQA